MKKLILVFLFSVFAYASQVDINNLNLIYVDKKGKPFTGKVVEYLDGNKYIYNFKNGKISGLAEYYQDDKLTSKTNFKNGLLDGACEDYYENGKLKVKYNYKNGKLDGKYEEYYENGKLSAKVNFEDEILEGLYEEYYENGNLKYKTIYKEDEIISKEYFYNENGELIKIEDLEENKEEKIIMTMINSIGSDTLNFILQIFENLKNLEKESKFNKDELSDNGEVSIVSKKNGKIYIKYVTEYPKSVIEIFKETKKIGNINLNFKGDNSFSFEMDGEKILVELLYNKNNDKHDRLKYIIESKEIKFNLEYNEYGLNGLQKAYYSNGKPKFEVEMKNGYLNGIYKEYDENGKLIKNEKYKEGELLK